MTFTITFMLYGSGTTTPSGGSVSVAQGANQTIIWTPGGDGYGIYAEWGASPYGGAYTEIDVATGTFTFTNVQADMYLYLEFTPAPKKKRYINTTEIANNVLTDDLYAWDSREDARLASIADPADWYDPANSMENYPSIPPTTYLDLTYNGSPSKGVLICGGYNLYNIYRILATSKTIIQKIVSGELFDTVVLNYYADFWCTDDDYVYLVEGGDPQTATPAKIHKIDMVNDTDVYFTGVPNSLDDVGEWGVTWNSWECVEGPIICDGTHLWWMSCTARYPTLPYNDHNSMTVINVADMSLNSRIDLFLGDHIQPVLFSRLLQDDTYLYEWYYDGTISYDIWRFTKADLSQHLLSPVSKDIRGAFVTGGYLYTANNLPPDGWGIRKLNPADLTEVTHYAPVTPTGDGMASDGTYVYWNGTGEVHQGKTGLSKALLSDFTWVDSIFEEGSAQSNAVWYMGI